MIALITVAGWFSDINYRALGHVYLLAVIALSPRLSRYPLLAGAIVSALTWDFVFIPPKMSFSVLDLDDALILGAYFLVALIAGELTARLRAQQEAERAREQREKLAMESDRLRRTLLDCVSHELRTPLAVLRSASERLNADGNTAGAAMVGEIRTATARLDRLITNLLHQTRLEAGALKPRFDACDIRDLLAAARRQVGDALASHPLTIAVPTDLPLVRADAALLEQVLANLLLNAALHTPAGTPITLTAGVEGRDRLFLRVADRGPGIAPELRDCLFDKFQRAPGARAGGVGLGLSIVRGFVAAHHGQVRIEENPGGGACFTVTLPAAVHGRIPDE